MKYAVLLTLLISTYSLASTTVVGNGDDGSDLEGFIEIKKGPIFNARSKAVKLLKKLNVKGVRSLGMLTPEVESSKIYLTRKDITDMELKKLGAFETDMRGYIYARTFPRPHAATRFFPVSKTLNEDQLIALHVHEGLHRSLPEFVRENEKIVTEITLAVTNPEANQDSISQVIDKLVPKTDPTLENMSNYYLQGDEIKRNIFEYDMEVAGSYSSAAASGDKVNVINILSSKLYPFGGRFSGLGLGLKFSFLRLGDTNAVGPLGINLIGQINTRTRFKIWWFLEHSLNSGADEKWQNTPLGRDLTRVGIKMHSLEKNDLTLVNSLTYTLPSSATDNTFSTPIEYEYGGIISARADLKSRYKSVGYGGFIEYSLADTQSIKQGQTFLVPELPREKVVVIGPEVGYLGENFSAIIFSKYIVNRDENFNLDRFSDIFHYGAGGGTLGLKINYLW